MTLPFSVVIPTYNRAVSLRACLDSLAAQEYPRDRFEVVIVDDGGASPAAEIAAGFRDRLAVSVHRQTRGGPAAARNTGANLARGTCIAFIDDDCLAVPRWLAAFDAAFQAHGERCVLGGWTLNPYPDRILPGVSDLILRVIREGALLVSTSGAVVGQLNGTAVYDTGDHAFGVPVRITARTWVGRTGVVNIDREVELSGRIHDKGTLIMEGLLGERYAQSRPLTLCASITFEQSYELVEGDSASCAELFAVLSSLSGVPLKQGLAVTGSVNQQGEVQPVGGVNEKVEGIFRVCKMRGLTGQQGVVMPRRNVQNLMLSREVVEAIRAGSFHVWAIDHVDEGLELLTGLRAGRRLRNGSWEPGSVNDLVDRRLAEMALSLKPHGCSCGEG